jgi:hypothetical protein
MNEKRPEVFGGGFNTKTTKQTNIKEGVNLSKEQLDNANNNGTAISKGIEDALIRGDENVKDFLGYKDDGQLTALERKAKEWDEKNKNKTNSVDNPVNEIKTNEVNNSEESTLKYADPEYIKEVSKKSVTLTYGKDNDNKVAKPKIDIPFFSLNDNIDINEPFDILALPSRGVFYDDCGENIKIPYLNASDEDLLSNPNLIRSGKFLEVLINRKLKYTNLTYSDLLVGDRNAIMIWLRGSAYGNNYDLRLQDPSNENDTTGFDYTVDLSKLDTIYFNDDVDENGLMTYTLPNSGDVLKFRFLTMFDIDGIIERELAISEVYGDEHVDTITYSLFLRLESINGNDDREYINKYSKYLIKLKDKKAFIEYSDSIESGIDLNINVRTPGGESFDTFLPFGETFFWGNN